MTYNEEILSLLGDVIIKLNSLEDRQAVLVGAMHRNARLVEELVAGSLTGTSKHPAAVAIEASAERFRQTGEVPTQKKIAEAIGVSYSCFRDWCGLRTRKGRKPIPQVQQAWQAFQAELDSAGARRQLKRAGGKFEI